MFSNNKLKISQGKIDTNFSTLEKNIKDLKSQKTIVYTNIEKKNLLLGQINDIKKNIDIKLKIQDLQKEVKILEDELSNKDKYDKELINLNNRMKIGIYSDYLEEFKKDLDKKKSKLNKLEKKNKNKIPNNLSEDKIREKILLDSKNKEKHENFVKK